MANPSREVANIMERLRIKIQGMSCGHCVGAVTGALTKVDSVTVEEVRVGSATMSYNPARTSPGAIAQSIEDAGYEAEPEQLSA